MSTPGGARDIMAFLLRLPASCAGLKAVTLAAHLRTLDDIKITEAEYGELAPEAEIALATVKSALVVLHEAAVKRERNDAQVQIEEAARRKE